MLHSGKCPSATVADGTSATVQIWTLADVPSATVTDGH